LQAFEHACWQILSLITYTKNVGVLDLKC